MYYKTGDDVDDGCGNFVASCRDTPFLGPIQILKKNSGYTSTQRLTLFLSVNTTYVELKFISPQQLVTCSVQSVEMLLA